MDEELNELRLLNKELYDVKLKLHKLDRKLNYLYSDLSSARRGLRKIDTVATKRKIDKIRRSQRDFREVYEKLSMKLYMLRNFI